MSDKNQSIAHSCLRSFLSALSAMVAIGIGLVVVVVVVMGVVASGEFGDGVLDFESRYNPVIVSSNFHAREKLSDDSPVILRLNIHGAIGTYDLNMNTVRRQLLEATEGALAGRVEGILLHIDSPGGTVTDADGIYRAVKEFKEQFEIPVYAYVDGLCASGGMYVASAADKIFASDVSLIGSVGVVISPFFNVTKLMEKLGVESKTVIAGGHKDEMNPFRSWEQDEDQAIQGIVNYYYDSFVDIVASRRPNMNKEKLVKEYGAKVFPAALAKKYGFIDESGSSLYDVEKSLAAAIDIEDNHYQTVVLEHRVSFSELFDQGSATMKNGVLHRVDLPGALHPKLMNKFLYMYVQK